MGKFFFESILIDFLFCITYCLVQDIFSNIKIIVLVRLSLHDNGMRENEETDYRTGFDT